MKKVMRALIGCLALLLTVPAFAQTDPDRQKIESAKIGLITNRLNLTAEQAPQFWAVYNEFNAKRQNVRRQLRQKNGQPGRSNAVDELQESVELKQRLVDLEKEYNSKFLKVISAQQLQELYKTEQMFNQMLLDRLGPGNRD